MSEQSSAASLASASLTGRDLSRDLNHSKAYTRYSNLIIFMDVDYLSFAMSDAGITRSEVWPRATSRSADSRGRNLGSGTLQDIRKLILI